MTKHVKIIHIDALNEYLSSSEMTDDFLKQALDFLEQKKFEEALNLCNGILSQHPQLERAHFIRGIVNRSLANFDEAERDFLECIHLGEISIEIFYQLARTRNYRGRKIEALNAINQGLSIVNEQSVSIDWAARISELFFQLGKPEETIFWGEKYLRSGQSHFDCKKRVALSYSLVQEHASSLKLLKQLLVDQPNNAEIHLYISILLRQTRNFSLAAYHLEIAGDLDPSLYDPWNLLLLSGSTLNFSKYAHYLKDALAMVDSNQRVTEPFCMFFGTDDPRIIKKANELHSKKFSINTRINRRARRAKGDGDRLRIGYLSADFKTHATSFLIEGLVNQHDRNRFEIFGFDISNNDGTSTRKRVIDSFDRCFNLLNCSDEESAMQIANCEIDILIDLKGYTEGARPRILSYRPCPLQINYLGYPGTLGSEHHDYIIGDSIVFRENSSAEFSEKQLQLPCCYQPNTPDRELGPPTGKKDHGLPESAFIMACFNHHWKFNVDTIAVWASILRMRPDSILWVLENLAGADVKQILHDYGIRKEQIVVAPLVSVSRHLERIHHADLFLDTFPCGAHTTASDAIFAGVPVMTKIGNSFHSRVSASLMIHAGCPEFVCESEGEYMEKILACSYEPTMLDPAKLKLRDRNSIHHPYNIRTTTAALEKAYLAVIHDKDNLSRSPIKVAPWW